MSSPPAPKRQSDDCDGQPPAKRALSKYQLASCAWDRAHGLETRMLKIAAEFKQAFDVRLAATLREPDMLSNHDVKDTADDAVPTAVQGDFFAVAWDRTEPHPMGWAALTVNLQCRQLTPNYPEEDTGLPDGQRVTVDVDLLAPDGPEFSVWDGGVACNPEEGCPEIVTDDMGQALDKVVRFIRIRVMGEDEAKVWDEEEEESREEKAE